MSYEAERIAIENRFATAWGATTPVAYQNVEFTPPTNPRESWVRVSVLNGASFQASLGNNPLYRHPGVIDISIFTPTGEGGKRAAQLVDQATAVFRGAQFSGILCRAPDVREVGPSDGWFQTSVSIPYQRDELF
jgi:hypothetical protein